MEKVNNLCYRQTFYNEPLLCQGRFYFVLYRLYISKKSPILAKQYRTIPEKCLIFNVYILEYICVQFSTRVSCRAANFSQICCFPILKLWIPILNTCWFLRSYPRCSNMQMKSYKRWQNQSISSKIKIKRWIRQKMNLSKIHISCDDSVCLKFLTQQLSQSWLLSMWPPVLREQDWLN